MNDFSGKVVLITGAGKGKGRALSLEFARRGAIVAANDISPLNVEQVVEQIRTQGGQARAYVEDVAKKMSAQALVQQVEEDWGSIDVLINHAAVEPHVPLLNMDEWDWHRTLDVNLTGAFLMLQSVGRVMRARRGGVIINLVTGSGSGVGSERGAYLASMGGLLWLTRQAAHELDPLGVRVHAVGTGLEAFQAAQENIPRQWMEAVMFLCASELNGQIVNVEE